MRSAELDRIERVHAIVQIGHVELRDADLPIVQAYTLLLASQFQGFCRDLHSECVHRLLRRARPARFRPTLQTALVSGRKLDRGTPNPANIGSDFSRLGLRFWGAVDQQDARNPSNRRRIEEMCGWRNAIAHQDFDRADLSPRLLALRVVQGWRTACEELADTFDAVLARYVESVTREVPW